jgi:4a-hydroxytetrahydrobiopterin dehydratase
MLRTVSDPAVTKKSCDNEVMTGSDTPLSRAAASVAVEVTGWRVLLGTLAASVAVSSLHQAAQVAVALAAIDGADGHLRVDVRPDRVELVLTDAGRITARDVELAQSGTAAVRGLGLAISPPSGGRPVQQLEIAIDALDIPALLPFWRAVLAYADEAPDSVRDPAGQGPTIWFQQMDEPRPQRNRIHFDITVPHDEAPARIQAALDAGGVLVSDTAARAFWILADAEGNEICVCTWQDRDSRE